MALQSLLFASDSRLEAASRNAPPIRYGERGNAILRLQLALLAAGEELPASTKKMSAVPDGIFGPETARGVQGFQRAAGLVVDGVPGQNTLARLDESMLRHPVSEQPKCATSPRNPPAVTEIHNALKSAGPEDLAHLASGNGSGVEARKGGGSGGRPPGIQPAAFGGGRSAQAFLPPVRSRVAMKAILRHLKPLSSSQVSNAKAVFGNSLVYQLAVLCDLKPPNASVTTALAVPNVVLAALGIPPAIQTSTICILFVGTFSPSRALLIHELAHVWQSQHHPDPTAYEQNSLASQGLAAYASLIKGVKASAYAYKPGKPFGAYGAEQIADQVECGVTAIVKHVNSVSPQAVDQENKQSLARPRYEISGGSGIVRCRGGTAKSF